MLTCICIHPNLSRLSVRLTVLYLLHMAFLVEQTQANGYPVKRCKTGPNAVSGYNQIV